MSEYGYYDFSEDYSVGEDELPDTDIFGVLERYWGYPAFRPRQEEIIRSVLSGRDTIGLLPTGGGKSLTFQVPAMVLPGLTVVVSPLISLMKDQVDGLKRRGIKAGGLHTGMARSEIRYTLERCRQGKLKLLYIAPERLGADGFLNQVADWNVNLIVVDEAHCISQWGYDFRPSYLGIARLRERLPDVPVLALTASATPAVVDDIAQRLEMTDPALFSLSFSRDNISFLVRITDDKLGLARRVLDSTTGPAIVYVRSRKRAREIAETLSAAGHPALFYHAGLDPDIKIRRQDEWFSGSVRTIVATTAFGMGIDKPDVRTVIHLDLPSTLEEYYQEAGRAGRDGLPSVAVMITSRRDKTVFARRLNDAFPTRDYIRRVYDEMCRFLNVPMGEAFGCVYEFNPEVMCVRYKMPLRPTLGALGILSRSGYIDYTGEVATDSRVHITVTREDLYDTDLDKVAEAVLMDMLRTCPGLFADYVTVSEGMIARRCGIVPEDVYQALLRMRRMRILDYVPRNVTPYVYFSANRCPSESLTFPAEVYDDRREAMARRLQAMEDFVFADTSCRVSRMLAYFGQDASDDCGKCDVCRARRPRRPFDAEAFERRLDDFFTMIAPATRLDVRSLEPHFPGRMAEVAEHLRSMIARGDLSQDGIYVFKC